MDFFASQDRARRNTGVLVILYVLAVLAIILGVYLAVRVLVFWQETKLPGQPTSPLFDPKLMAYIGFGTLMVVGGATLVKIMELSAGGAVIAESLGGRRVEPGSPDPLDRKVLNVVEEMAIASGMAVPDVYMLDRENRINAFAAGHSVDAAVIGVTRGCVEQLKRDELQGVIAHEFSHILHGDMKLNLRLIGVLHGILVIGLIGSLLMRNAAYTGGSRSRDNRGVLVMIVLGLALFVIGMLGTLFGRLIQAAVSRQREFLADASAVRFTRHPGGIAGALKRIGARKDGSRINAGKVQEFRHMYFGAGASEMVSALATHPPLAERIRRIEPRWNGRFPEPEAPPVPERATSIKTPPPAPGRSQQEVLRSILKAGILTGAVQSVGRPTHANLVQAQELLGRIPQRLRDAVQTLAGAHAVVCATVIDADSSSRQKQLMYLEGRGENLRDDVVNYLSLMRSLGAEVRLPLVELAMPVLRHVNEDEYTQLMKDVDYLSRADAMIDPFEWVLGRVLRHHLAAKFEEKKPGARTARIADKRADVALLLAQIARAGHNDPAMQQAAFDAGAALLDGAWQMVPPAETTLPALDAAVDSLTFLLATEKKTVLEACAATIAADREVTVTEGELLRGISDILECPMPLL